MKRNDKFPIETALEKLINEFRFSLRRATQFFFTIPKNQMDKYAWLMETISWLLLTIAIIWRVFGG